MSGHGKPISFYILFFGRYVQPPKESVLHVLSRTREEACKTC